MLIDESGQMYSLWYDQAFIVGLKLNLCKGLALIA